VRLYPVFCGAKVSLDTCGLKSAFFDTKGYDAQRAFGLAVMSQWVVHLEESVRLK